MTVRKRLPKGRYTEHERGQLRNEFESELLALAEPYCKMATAPERVLAERMERFIGELFVFVQCPEVPSENNAAERAIRPAVVARKISGGTRSPKGSTTASILRSVFETWGLQGCNPNRVGGVVTGPTSHTTGHAGPHPAVHDVNARNLP